MIAAHSSRQPIPATHPGAGPLLSSTDRSTAADVPGQMQLPGTSEPTDAETGQRWLQLAANSLTRAQLGNYDLDNALQQVVAATPIVDAYVRSSPRKEVVLGNMLTHSMRLATLHGRVLGGEAGVSDGRVIHDLKIDVLTALNLMRDPAQVRTRPIA